MVIDDWVYQSSIINHHSQNVFEPGDDFCAKDDGQRPLGYEVNQEDDKGLFAVLFVIFFQGLLNVHSCNCLKVLMMNKPV